MKKAVATLLLAASFAAMGASASAANIVGNETLTFVDNTTDFGAAFGQGTTGSTFTENYTFSYSNAFDVSSAVISIALKNMSSLAISSFTLNGNGQSYTGTSTVLGGVQYYLLQASQLAAGTYTLSVAGTVTGAAGGSFGGNISVAPVPEASTVAMMLGGLSVIGFAAMRRRRQDTSRQSLGMMAA